MLVLTAATTIDTLICVAVWLHALLLSYFAIILYTTDPRLRVHEAVDIAAKARRALQRSVKDLCSAEIHLDLVETYMSVGMSSTANGISDVYSNKRQVQSIGKVLDKIWRGGARRSTAIDETHI
jgi:hypothetical protein